MIDWVSIRTEYVSTPISTRALAEKRGVSYNTLRKKAEGEGWTKLRKEHERKQAEFITQKVADAVSEDQVDRIRKLVSGGTKAADLLLTRLDQMKASGKINVNEVKAITEALRNVRNLYCIEGAGEDVKYQKARELLGGVPDALDG